jgi:peptidoglycan/LPS O-acetylase OafA/YrhL
VPYWFVSTYAQIILLAALPFGIKPVREAVKQRPFEAGAAALLAVALLIELTEINDIYYNVRHRNPIIALELLLAGWCLFFATTTKKKLIATAALLLVWMQNFGLIEANITGLMLGGSLCVLWGLRLSLPSAAARALLFFGSLSMFIYLAHVPALYALSRYLPNGPPLYVAAVASSLVLALALKKASDVLVNRLMRKTTQGSAATLAPIP